jgi:hypothetical protein
MVSFRRSAAPGRCMRIPASADAAGEGAMATGTEAEANPGIKKDPVKQELNTRIAVAVPR